MLFRSGLETTLGVTLDMMIAHGKAVVRGSSQACVIVDMPFGSYQASPAEAFKACARVMAETGCAGVKLEGGEAMAPTIRFLTERGIPVIAHVGLTPQSVHAFGGFKVQGRGEAAARVLEHAIGLEKAGAFAVVLEAMPSEVAADITRSLQVPTIGIGAGVACDAQVLVVNDLLGLNERLPKLAKAYADLRTTIAEAATAFARDVEAGTFPDDAHSYS